jgi:hypothetical protein
LLRINSVEGTVELYGGTLLLQDTFHLLQAAFLSYVEAFLAVLKPPLEERDGQVP